MSAAHTRQLRGRAPKNDPEPAASVATEIGADLDRALAQFRTAMPGCGLKLVVPPPLADGKPGRLSLSAWRRGEQASPVHAGVSAGEAVQRLFDSEAQENRERSRRADCTNCRGIGWYVAAGGIRAICTHTSPA